MLPLTFMAHKYTALVTMPCRPPLCLRCKKIGHVRGECTTDMSGRIGTYAGALSVRERVVDSKAEEEREVVAVAPALSTGRSVTVGVSEYRHRIEWAKHHLRGSDRRPDGFGRGERRVDSDPPGPRVAGDLCEERTYGGDWGWGNHHHRRNEVPFKKSSGKIIGGGSQVDLTIPTGSSPLAPWLCSRRVHSQLF